MAIDFYNETTMLIKCGECGASVSDQAEICPICGYPLKKSRTATEVRVAQKAPEVQTIEKTGKIYKGLRVFFWILILVVCPLLWLTGNGFVGVAVLIISVIGETAVRIGTWWDHG